MTMAVEINDIIAAAEAETHIGNRDRVIHTGTLTLREHPPVDHDLKLRAEHFARWRNAKNEMVEVQMVPAEKPAVVHDGCGSVPISFVQEMEYFKTHQIAVPTNEQLRAELVFGFDLSSKPDQTVLMVGTPGRDGWTAVWGTSAVRPMTDEELAAQRGHWIRGESEDLFTLRTQGIGPFMLDDDVAAIREAACPKPDPYIYIGGVALDVREWGELLCRRMIPVINKFSNKGVHLQSTPIPCVAEQFMRDLAEIVATTVVGDDGQVKRKARWIRNKS